MFHSGLVAYANCSLKILAACEQQPTCMKRKIHTANTLLFGKQQRSFLVMPYLTAIQRTLMKVRSFGVAVLEVEPQVFGGVVHGNEINAEEDEECARHS